ncbi:MAG: hypothetical protein NTX12_03745 [Actinobacteria bacterium]|nr:hypothetical protein [Actinomycetota bacterium]
MNFGKLVSVLNKGTEQVSRGLIRIYLNVRTRLFLVRYSQRGLNDGNNERGDVPGWVLVVLMTTGLVTAIWTIAAPRLTAILRNSLDSMNGIR